jgi:hypothetical protein
MTPLQKLNAIELDQVNAAMLLGDLAGPDICTQALQWLRFSDAIKFPSPFPGTRFGVHLPC